MSELTHELREKFHDREVPTPMGYPTLTFNTKNITQEHIDAFDDEQKHDYFKEVKKKEAEKEKEEEPKTIESLKKEVDKLEKKWSDATPEYREGRHGKALEEKILALRIELEGLEAAQFTKPNPNVQPNE